MIEQFELDKLNLESLDIKELSEKHSEVNYTRLKLQSRIKQIEEKLKKLDTIEEEIRNNYGRVIHNE